MSSSSSPRCLLCSSALLPRKHRASSGCLQVSLPLDNALPPTRTPGSSSLSLTCFLLRLTTSKHRAAKPPHLTLFFCFPFPRHQLSQLSLILSRIRITSLFIHGHPNRALLRRSFPPVRSCTAALKPSPSTHPVPSSLDGPSNGSLRDLLFSYSLFRQKHRPFEPLPLGLSY